MVTFADIEKAYMDCRRTKRNSIDALLFELGQEENIRFLVDALNSKTYTPTTSVCFYIDRPKAREIFAADFRDRVVHHYIYTRLAPVWEKIFIDQSFACRPAKGTHKGAQVLQEYTRKATRNGKRKAYYLKMDISNFFMSIHKPTLYKILMKKCRDADLAWLLWTVIFHDPRMDVRFVRQKHSCTALPAHKSLFNAPREKGLPIGNLTSQFFANVYLNELDQFVKHELKCRYYVRYVDDFIILSSDKEQLCAWQVALDKFAHNRLRLEINPAATKIDSIFNGVDFCGFIVRPHYKLCRRRVIGNLKERLRQAEEKLICHGEDKTVYYYPLDYLEKLGTTVNSYLAQFQHAQTTRLRESLFGQNAFLTHYFYLSSSKVIPTYNASKSTETLRQQALFFARRFAKSVVLLQIGCYYEAFEDSAKHLSECTGYKLKRDWRSFQFACGFHKRLLPKACEKLESHKISYVIICQTGKEMVAAMERAPYKWVDFIAE